MIRTALCALALLLLSSSPALAKYLPLPLADMFGSSDLIVTGTIVEVGETTFVLQIDKVVAGEFDDPRLEVTRFRDWACASRWAPYEPEQRVLLCLFRATDTEGNPKWAIRSGGGEGEMPIVDGEVHLRMARLPFAAAERREVYGGELYAHVLPLSQVLRTIRAYRKAYAWDLDRGTPSPRVTGARCADAAAAAALREQSELGAFLAEQTETSRYYQG
jgi:hypothetical protein